MWRLPATVLVPWERYSTVNLALSVCLFSPYLPSGKSDELYLDLSALTVSRGQDTGASGTQMQMQMGPLLWAAGATAQCRGTVPGQTEAGKDYRCSHGPHKQTCKRLDKHGLCTFSVQGCHIPSCLVSWPFHELVASGGFPGTDNGRGTLIP